MPGRGQCSTSSDDLATHRLPGYLEIQRFIHSFSHHWELSFIKKKNIKPISRHTHIFQIKSFQAETQWETLLDAVSRLHGTSFSFSVLFIVSQDPLVPCQCRGVSVECPIEIPSIFFSLGFLTCQAVLVMYRFNSLHVYVILCLCIHHVELHCIPSQWNTPRTCKSVEPPQTFCFETQCNS